MFSNLYIVYELNNWPRNPAYNFALKNCLSGSVKLVRNTIKTKCTYNGQGIAIDWKFYGVSVMTLLETLLEQYKVIWSKI